MRQPHAQPIRFRRLPDGSVLVDDWPPRIRVFLPFVDEMPSWLVHREGSQLVFSPENGWAVYAPDGKPTAGGRIREFVLRHSKGGNE